MRFGMNNAVARFAVRRRFAMLRRFTVPMRFATVQLTAYIGFTAAQFTEPTRFTVRLR